MPISELDVVVSMQDGGSRDVVDGHLSWGVLWDRDVVVAPGPLDWLDQPRLEVLLARVLDGDHPDVVRITPRSVAVIGPRDNREGAAAVVRLPGPVFDVRLHALDSARLNVDIGARRDVWAALAAQGAVPGDIRTWPASDLGAVAEWEARQQVDRVRDLRQPRFPPDWPNIFCILNPRNCMPENPFPPRTPGA